MIEPKAIVLEYFFKGARYVERIPILPGESADDVARRRMNELSAVLSFTIREVW